MKRIALILAAAVVLSLTMAAAFAAGNSQQEDQSGPGLDFEYASSIGLTVLDSKPADCNGWMTVEGETGWCIDGTFDSTAERIEVMWNLWGFDPSERQIRFEELNEQIADRYNDVGDEAASTDTELAELHADLKAIYDEMKAAGEVPLSVEASRA
jgi:hypothetical protein